MCAQRAGTKLVDITYDLTDAENASLLVTMKISQDAGATWDVPCTSVSGDGIGLEVTPGTGKSIVWDAGADWNRQRSDLMRVKITASVTYLVVDLSAGPGAASYPVSYLAEVPAGGWTDEYKTTKLVLRCVPAGTFTMGSPEGEVGRWDGTESQHQVTLTKNYYVGVFEVTQKQWNLVMGAWPSWFKNPDYRDSRPVEQVSYNDIRGSNAGSGWPANNAVDAGSFLGRLRAKTGLVFDLPTEAQREYACRAGTTTALYSGKELTGTVTCPNVAELARYKGNSGASGENSDTSVGSAKVGSYLPNPWGLYDMYGNVSEWCLDWWDMKDYSTQAVTDPKGNVPVEGKTYKHIQRSGSWGHAADYCRSARRYWAGPAEWDKTRGFRLAAVQDEDAYVVIDLSAGATADSYPVSYCSIPPAGGWTDEYKTTKLVLRKIPAGTFTMGSPVGEVGRWDGTETQHQVTLTKNFYVGVFEVTQKQWNLVMGTWPSYFKNLDCRDSRPVEQISYNDIRGSNAGSGWPAHNAVDADSFIGRLRAKTGLVFDLPTEAQREYACRAGTTAALYSGKELTNKATCPNVAELARYKGNSGVIEENSDTSVGSAKVGSYLPNQWGLYDMYGNVSEWCLDWWDAKDYSTQAVTDPKGDVPVEGKTYKHIQRGGSWGHAADNCRSARRSWAGPAEWAKTRGFRLAAVLVEDTYLVIDLSAGSEADSYPISYRPTEPAGGWPDEYKTTKLVLRKIPAGTFMMGSPADEEWRGANETLHQVTLTQSFYVGVFEVTQKQWERVMGTWPSYFKNSDYRDSRPVDYIYFKDIRGSNAGSGWPANNDVDANSFLGRLRSKTSLAFDLPTEAQWEYACRAGTETALNSGKNLIANQTCPNMNEVGRYTSNGGLYNPEDGDTTKGTAKVGSYLPNQWGLYDMHGNVFEYCLDWWDGSDYPAEAVTDPKGLASGSGRVIRGGYYRADASANCSARRNKTPPNEKSNGMGFRLAWPIP
ncbi:MAG: formylglycine-generating enzyme family protein [Lentisphaeria bacterium]